MEYSDIVSALSSLGIPTALNKYEGSADKYIVFGIYNETENDFADDEATAEVYYVNMNYWVKSPHDLSTYKQIKSLMKQNGFIFDGAADVPSDNYYGKNLDFIYKEYL